MDFMSNSLRVNKVGLAADEGVKTSNGVKCVSDSGPTLVSLRTELKRSLSGADSMTLPLHTLLAHTLHTLGRGVQRSTKSRQHANTEEKSEAESRENQQIRNKNVSTFFPVRLKWN